MVIHRDAKHKLTSREIDAKYVAQGRATVIKYNMNREDERWQGGSSIWVS